MQIHINADLYSHHHVVSRVGIFMRGISSQITMIVTRRVKRPIVTGIFFHLAPRIHFARTYVQRAINPTNAKCGKLMSAAST